MYYYNVYGLYSHKLFKYLLYLVQTSFVIYNLRVREINFLVSKICNFYHIYFNVNITPKLYSNKK
jgi:hypothetical protein